MTEWKTGIALVCGTVSAAEGAFHECEPVRVRVLPGEVQWPDRPSRGGVVAVYVRASVALAAVFTTA